MREPRAGPTEGRAGYREAIGREPKKELKRVG